MIKKIFLISIFIYRFYFFGCLTVKENGEFTFNKAPPGTFFMGKSTRSSLPKTAISRNDIRQIESEWLALKNTYCTSRTTATVTVSFKDSQTNVMITNAKVTAYLNYNLLVTDSSVDGSDGTITFNVDCVGNFSGTVTADGF